MRVKQLADVLFDSKFVVYENRNGELKTMYDNHYGDSRDITPCLKRVANNEVYMLKPKTAGFVSYLEIYTSQGEKKYE